LNITARRRKKGKQGQVSLLMEKYSPLGWGDMGRKAWMIVSGVIQ